LLLALDAFRAWASGALTARPLQPFARSALPSVAVLAILSRFAHRKNMTAELPTNKQRYSHGSCSGKPVYFGETLSETGAALGGRR